jgi:hypothetical protein
LESTLFRLVCLLFIAAASAAAADVAAAVAATAFNFIILSTNELHL